MTRRQRAKLRKLIRKQKKWNRGSWRRSRFFMRTRTAL